MHYYDCWLHREIEVVYTSCPEFESKKGEGFKFVHYSQLDEKKVAWISSKIREMENGKKSPAERKFMEQMRGFKWSIMSQVFFCIKDKFYFLDFFVPKLGLAFEIDGAENHRHISNEIKDITRDEDFWHIGIKTVRFTASEVGRENFRKGIFEPRVKACFAQEKYDPFTLYYDIPKIVRFEGKKTTNQKLLEALIKVLEKTPENSQVVIATSFMYLIEMGERDEIWNPEGNNLDLLERIYELKKGKGVGFLYTGEGKNIERNHAHRTMVRIWAKRFKDLPNATPLYRITYSDGSAYIKKYTKLSFLNEKESEGGRYLYM